MSSPARWCLASALLGAASILCAPAQVVDFQKERSPIVEIHDLWRFHTGDDTRWADPSFDDSQWSLIRTDQGWSNQGYAGYGGLAWYRLDLRLPLQHTQLALHIPSVDVSCQIFADGRLIGHKGELPPHPLWLTQQNMVFPIPDDLARSGSLHLAIRVWNDPAYRNIDSGGLNSALRVGELQAVEQWRWLQERRIFWENSFISIQLGFNLLGAFTSLGLFLLRRNEREYLWFSLFLLDWAIYQMLQLHNAFFPDPYYLSQWLIQCTFAAGLLGLPVFIVSLFRQRRGGLFYATVLVSISLAVVSVLQAYWPAALVLTLASGVALMTIPLLQVLIVLKACRAGNREAKILIAGIALNAAGVFIVILGYLFPQSPFISNLFRFILYGIQWPVPANALDVAGDLSNICIIAVLILRFARSRRDEERFKSELEAARTVQQVLIPEEIPTIPGLELECIYRPAGQVGGDFFQILPTRGGGALIVIGDVSGKGMPAAMAVSLLVGTVRTLAHYTQSPAAILAAMNQRMLARSKYGFTTCLILRIDPGGAAILANAAHLAPYINAQEIPVDSGLPLGLAAESVYTESNFQLDTGQELTLLTDGVAEARAKTGELFGFERTASISILSAQQIAATAAAFGQQDDITVLKICRSPITEPAGVRLVTASADSAA